MPKEEFMDNFLFKDNKFYLLDENNQEVAFISFYYQDNETIVVDHTFVNENLRGQGIALQLVNQVVAFARDNNLKIIPVCSYANKVLNRNSEYQDILKKG